MIVSPARTVVTWRQVAAALAPAWKEERGVAPTIEQLSVVLAQWAFETGHGAACRCYNLGNEKWDGNEKIDRCYYPVKEFIPGKGETWFYPNDPACAFVAYPSLEAGARGHIRLLAMRYPAAWHRAVLADAIGFVRALKSAYYFSGDVDAYAAGVNSIAVKFARELHNDDLSRLPTLRRGDKGVFVRLAQRLLSKQGWPELDVDGKFGANTLKVVETERKDLGLTPSGEIDGALWKVLIG